MNDEFAFYCEPCGVTHDIRRMRMEYEYRDTQLEDGRTLRTPVLTAESREAYRHWELTDEIPRPPENPSRERENPDYPARLIRRHDAHH